ncbi:hypothetical protein ON010_g8737 [Phytophthora cinnamomi]|nr:hypothetical protein ON010_g8737 [Phytophthora cinnamomi]
MTRRKLPQESSAICRVHVAPDTRAAKDSRNLCGAASSRNALLRLKLSNADRKLSGRAIRALVADHPAPLLREELVEVAATFSLIDADRATATRRKY